MKKRSRSFLEHGTTKEYLRASAEHGIVGSSKSRVRGEKWKFATKQRILSRCLCLCKYLRQNYSSNSSSIRVLVLFRFLSIKFGHWQLELKRISQLLNASVKICDVMNLGRTFKCNAHLHFSFFFEYFEFWIPFECETSLWVASACAIKQLDPRMTGMRNTVGAR